MAPPGTSGTKEGHRISRCGTWRYTRAGDLESKSQHLSPTPKVSGQHTRHFVRFHERYYRLNPAPKMRACESPSFVYKPGGYARLSAGNLSPALFCSSADPYLLDGERTAASGEDTVKP